MLTSRQRRVFGRGQHQDTGDLLTKVEPEMVCVAGQKVRSSAIDRGEKNGEGPFRRFEHPAVR